MLSCPMCQRPIDLNDVTFAWDHIQKRSIMICRDPSCRQEFRSRLRRQTKELRKSEQQE